MLRASSYTIYVDLPNNSDEILLVHGFTGAYDKVSRRVATYIRSLELGRPPKPLYGVWSAEQAIDGCIPPPSEQTVAVLKKRGYLTELSQADEERLFHKIATLLHKQQCSPNYVFMPTYDCNLRCPYCFQDHMRTDPTYRHLRRTMSRQLVDRIFAAMPQIEADHGLPAEAAHRRSIGFFGGEPLLEHNRPIIEYIIKKAHEVGGANFSAVTNGTDLHAYRDLLGPDLIAILQITLDGPPPEHDQRRAYADGQGSFARIAHNITMALELGVRINVRLNIDRHNIHVLPAFADEISARGWKTYPTFNVYTAPVQATNGQTDTKTTFSSWELDRALNQMRTAYPDTQVIDRPDDRLRNQAHMLFSRRAAPLLRSTFCGAHTSMYVFDPFGDVYACWERTGDPHIRIGAVTGSGEFVCNETLHNVWRSRDVTMNAICGQCRYGLYCGGGCASQAEKRRGEFFANFCDGFAARFRTSVAEAYLDHVAGVAGAASPDRGCDR